MELEIKNSSGPPPGLYRATFAGVERTTHDEFGAGLRFDFTIVDGEHTGALASRITSASPTLKNAAGKIIGGIVGALAVGRVDLAAHIGKEYLVLVEIAPSGTATRVVSVLPR